MATAVQLRRGSTAQHATFTGLLAEVTVDTDKKTLVVHDAVTPGGNPVATSSDISDIQSQVTAATNTANTANSTANTANSTANNALTAVSGRVAFDQSQALTGPQKTQAQNNIDVYSKAEVDLAVAAGATPVNTQIHNAASKTSLVDADEFGIADSTDPSPPWSLKKVTLANVIASIFRTSRTIANAQFATSTFKLFNAAGTPRALTFTTTALTADRSIIMPDRAVDLGNVPAAGIFVSSPLTVTLGANGLVSHGLPSAPRKVSAYAVMTAAVTPLAVGDMFEIRTDSNGSNNGYGVQVSIPAGNATQVRYQVGSAAIATYLLATGAQGPGGTISVAQAQLIIIAEL